MFRAERPRFHMPPAKCKKAPPAGFKYLSLRTTSRLAPASSTTTAVPAVLVRPRDSIDVDPSGHGSAHTGASHRSLHSWMHENGTPPLSRSASPPLLAAGKGSGIRGNSYRSVAAAPRSFLQRVLGWLRCGGITPAAGDTLSTLTCSNVRRARGNGVVDPLLACPLGSPVVPASSK